MQKPTPEQIAEHDAQVAERFALLPESINSPTRANTAVCIPSADGRCEMGFARGLIDSIPYWSGLFEMPFCSHVSLARNRLMHSFLASPFEWAVLIDTDIVFTGADFQQLIRAVLQTPEKNVCYAATAPYAKKDDTGEAIEAGLGFAIVHRSVYEVLAKTLCLTSEFRGQSLVDFHVSGTLGATSHWMGEDAAFWLLCREIGVIPRIERRCDLQHIGRRAYELERML